MNLANIGIDYRTSMSNSNGAESNDLRNKLKSILNESRKTESLGRTTDVSEALNELNVVCRESLTNNLDSEESTEVSFETFIEAQRIIVDFLSSLPGYIPMPEISSVNTGGVLFEWYVGRFSTFAFIVHENAKLNYSVIFNKSDIRNGSFILYDSFPKDITLNLNKLYSPTV